MAKKGHFWPPTEKVDPSGTGKILYPKIRFLDFEIDMRFSENPQTLIWTRCASSWVMDLIPSTKTLSYSIFSKKTIFLTHRNFWRQQNLGYEMTDFGSLLVIISDFRPFLVEISEVLPPEIYTQNPDWSDLSLEKNKSFGPIETNRIQFLYPAPVDTGFGRRMFIWKYSCFSCCQT